MKKFMIIVALFALVTSLQAAQLYYQFPDAAKIKDNDRVLVFQNNSGNRNYTGAKLKSEILGGDGALSKQPTSKNRYARIMEFRNYSGQITSYVTANGIMVLGGRTPQPLSVSAISPPNGFTGYSTSKIPNIMFNKSMIEYASDYTLPSGVFVLVGQTLTSSLNPLGGSWMLNSPVLATNTSYTLRFYRQNLPQTDGETTSSCGTAMTDVGGYCQSTFTTGDR